MKILEESALTLNSILESLKNSKTEDGKVFKIAFLRNITLEPIKPYLEFFLSQLGHKLEVYFGEYDNIMQDILDKSSELYRFSPDSIVVVSKLEKKCPNLVYNFTSLSPLEVEEHSKEVLSDFEQMFSNIRSNTNVPILFHNFELAIGPSLGVMDASLPNGQTNTIRLLNLKLSEISNSFPNCFPIDVDLIQSKIGYERYFDRKYWHIGKAPYSKDSYPLIAKEYSKVFRANLGKVKKCLVLDLDNTMWGGILGEDGFNGIKIGEGYPSSAFTEFQKAVLSLHDKGVILAINSKNNMDDVLEVLEKHPDMILRKKHFANIKANWDDKVTNLKRISEELNIGLDSLVFIDDSEFEIGLVRKELPEVQAVLLVKDVTTYANFLKNLSVFDTLTISEEDKNRTKMYQAEKSRKTLKLETNSLGEYLKSLKMEVIVGLIDDFSIPRVSQLTQRSNQFNLTTKRYSEGEILKFKESENYDVLTLQLNDIYGTSGIIGVGILIYNDGVASIDSLLMSCRVIGRGVEKVFLNSLIKRAENRNQQCIRSKYIKTNKNKQVENFYNEGGFETLEDSGDCKTYALSLKNVNRVDPDHFTKIVFNGV